MQSVQDIIRGLGPSIANTKSRFHIAPEIPEKQLNNAVKKAKLKSIESVVAFIDGSMFQDGKEGVLLTGTRLYLFWSSAEAVVIDYETIADARYEEKIETNKKGKTKTHITNYIELTDGKTIVTGEFKGWDNQSFVKLLLEIRNCDVEYEDTDMTKPLAEMDEEVKVAYLKIVINMVFYDDMNIDEPEYTQIIMLMSRLNLSPISRGVLREYMSELEGAKLEDVSTKKNISELEEKSETGLFDIIAMSLVKDLINIYFSTKKENNITNFKFLQEYKELLHVDDKKIDFFVELVNNERKMLSSSGYEFNFVVDELKELAAKAGAVGVPVAAIYFSGSVVGLSAAGMTSGLAALGLGGLFGLSSMATGIGVVALISVGTYKAIKHITSDKEREMAMTREVFIQEIIKNIQNAVNMLMEDLIYFSGQIKNLVEENNINKEKFKKITQKLILLSKASMQLKTLEKECKSSILRGKCPSKLNFQRLKDLTKEPTKQKLYDIVIKNYEKRKYKGKDGNMQMGMLLKEDISVDELEAMSKILESLGYFDIKNVLKSKLKK